MSLADSMVAAKITDLAMSLQSEGFRVSHRVGDMPGYDLTAERPGERLAFAVIARSELGAHADNLMRLRRQARTDGFDDFRLVAVHRKAPVSVRIDGLSEKLLDLLLSAFPPELDEFSGHIHVDSLESLEIEEIDVAAHGIRLRGSGVVELTMQFASDRPHGPGEWATDFPFEFDVLLDHRLGLVKAESRMAVCALAFHE